MQSNQLIARTSIQNDFFLPRIEEVALFEMFCEIFEYRTVQDFNISGFRAGFTKISN